MENKNKLITTMQTLIFALGFLYLIEARVMFKYYNLKALVWQIAYFISWGFLFFATIRMSRKSLKKWEAILYFILDIACVALIIHSVFYVGVTYEDFLDAEDSGLGYMFMMILYGLPYLAITLTLSIISLVKLILTKPGNQSSEKMETIVANVNKTAEEKEQSNEVGYCSFCGKQINSNANYCKYCGRKKE